MTIKKKKYSCLPIRLCAWFWHHQLARGTHTPPVRGKHPACSRNCQAGLTAGTPCSALRGLSENPFLAVTLTVLILLSQSTRPVELFFSFLSWSALTGVAPPAPEPQQGTLCYHFCSGTPHPTPGIRLAFCHPGRKACSNHRTPPPRGYPGGRNLQPRVPRPGSQATPRGERCGLVKRAKPWRPGGGLPCLPDGARGLRGGGAGRAAGSGIRSAAVHRAAARRAGSGLEAARHCWGGRGRRVRAGASRPRARLDPGLPGADPPPRGASTCGPVPARGRPQRRRPQVPAPAAARSQLAAEGRRAAAPLRRRRSGLGAGRSPRPQSLASGGPPRRN